MADGLNRVNVCAAIGGILAFIAFLSVAACTTTNPPLKTEVSPEPSASTAAAKDLSFFDSIVTPEVVFPDPATRALYEEFPPDTTEGGGRRYSFVLIRQPGMSNRHFHVITVIWASAGTFSQGVGGTGGPGGGFVDFTTRTQDGTYDLRVSEAMLLPDGVEEAEFDLHSTVERLLLRYSQNLNNSSTKLLRGK
jgi:hypothetical protein